ncbi:serine/threonine-protein kinase [Knoellia subterranea]|uniref:non-specific serine/threonine protein kinase n=1 Tax=Knoellia subterranea KCTC 19937 TaxID=1385521 RepID=A0A0A0JS12_9MICO|nr:serine/threonine-protein kinase [Knoellia subterranea]KGN38857.1 hypothetical protein N803_06770 [Knoellia subterranea KCTC 19937]
METSDKPSETGYAGRHRIVAHRAPSVPGYDLVEPIGQGGSGAVWSASGVAGADVAIKIVSALDAEDALVELAVLGGITDPHLVRLHDAIALPSGQVALVLDRLRGGSLGSVVVARGHLSAGETVTVLSPLASTLGRLHAVGVVHGDVSPGNVLLDLDGRPFLSDLGVARIAGTRVGDLRGTDGFVAPEVALGGEPGPASDVFALGALAWFTLTGEVPGPAGIRGSLADLVPGLPERLVDVIEAMLRTTTTARPDAVAVATELFESATPEAVLLAEGVDDVGLLTRRIRAAAGAAGVPAAGSPEPRQARWARSAAARLGNGSSSLVGWAGGAIRRARAVLTVVSVVAIVAALAVGAVGWIAGRDDAHAASRSEEAAWGPRPGEGAAPGPSQSVQTRPRSVSVPGPSPSGHRADQQPGATTAPDPRTVRDAPRSDPRGLVTALAEARAAAWSSGIAARLIEVDAPRSPALARDTEVLAGVQRANQRYVGLTFTVREAQFVGEAAGVATLRVRIDTGAHTVRGPGGDVSRPAVAAGPVLLDVVRTDSGWRVRDVRADQAS